MLAKNIARFFFYLLVAVAAVCTAIAISLLIPMPSDGATAPQKPVERHCHTVTAKTYNKQVRLLDKLTGKRHHRATKKVCKHTTYKRIKQRVRKARWDCVKRAHWTEASVYWPGGDSGGMTGSCGWYLGTFKYGFAELGMGHYMGGLPCGTVVYVHGPGGTVAAPKVDIGAGSGSPSRAIDLWDQTGRAVGIGDGVGQIQYSKRNCWIRM